VLCAAAVLTVLATGCSQTLEASDIEREVAAGVDDQQGVEVEVSCPDDIKAEDGGTFTCTATDSEGTEWDVDVVQQDADGNVEWTMDVLNLGLVEDQLAPEVSAEVGTDVTIECPEVLVSSAQGSTLDCKATDDSGEGVIRITSTDGEGNVEWVLNP
jgi:hypothetical protein